MIVVLCHGSRVALLGKDPIGNDECKIEELAWHLSNIYRFNGMGVTVAQHSCLTAELGHGCEFAKLFHDAHESICQDLPTPCKEALDHLSGGKWAEMEGSVAGRLRRRYGLPTILPRAVKTADMEAARIEVGSLFTPEVQRAYRSRGLEPLYHPTHSITHKWTPDESFSRFMKKYKEIGPGIP